MPHHPQRVTQKPFCLYEFPPYFPFMNTPSCCESQFNRFAISTEFNPGANHVTLSDLIVITPTVKRIRLISIYICAVQAGAGNPRFRLIRRSSANVGGTAVALIPSPWDSASPTSWTKVEQYTARPTSVGDIAATFRTTPVQFAAGGARHCIAIHVAAILRPSSMLSQITLPRSSSPSRSASLARVSRIAAIWPERQSLLRWLPTISFAT